MPYLLEHGGAQATFTVVTGAAADHGGFAPVTAIGQGGVVSMANVGCQENQQTNVRFNEVYLAFRVDYDRVWEEKGGKDCTKASDYARHYEELLARPEIRSCRISHWKPEDLDEMRFESKIKNWG